MEICHPYIKRSCRASRFRIAVITRTDGRPSTHFESACPLDGTCSSPRCCKIAITLIFRLLTDAPDATRTESSRNLSAMAWFQQSAAGVDDRALRSGSQNRAESRCCGSPCSLAEAFSAIGDCLFDRSGQDALVPVGAGEP